MNELMKKLKKLKEINWENAAVSFFIAKRKLVERRAEYEIFQVNIDETLRRKLRNIACRKLKNSNEAREYEFTTGDLDKDLLGIPISETDMQKILEMILNDEDPKLIDKYENLMDAWLYIARLDVEGHSPLFSTRRISKSWTTKKVSQPVINAVFRRNMLVDLGQEKIFRIDETIDFFAHDDLIFIADKQSFETALNFREGMLKNRDEIVHEFSTLGLFEEPQSISKYVGDNMRLLRRLSQVKKSGYYRKPDFLENLKIINSQDGWGIEYSPVGKILAREDNIDTILRVLNNDRLTSKINAEEFDVDVKHKISPAN